MLRKRSLSFEQEVQVPNNVLVLDLSFMEAVLVVGSQAHPCFLVHNNLLEMQLLPHAWLVAPEHILQQLPI